MKKIVVIGSLNMDYVMNVDRMPEAGETMFANGFVMNPGGKGANQAYAMGKLDGRVSMIGAVGEDPAGKALVENLKNAGVDVSGIETVCAPTGAAAILVEPGGTNRIMVNRGANALVDKKMIDRHRDLIRGCDIVVMQLEIPAETAAYAAKLAREEGKYVILDPAPAPSAPIPEILQYVDLVKPNEIEVMALAGNHESPAHAAETLLSKGVRCVLVTLGKNGSMLFAAGRPARRFEAVPAKAVDTTAAGDCFSGALAVALSEEKDPEEAIRFASAAAAVSVSRPGAQMSMPTRDEVKRQEGSKDV